MGDNLDRDAAAARAAGMSYGKWKAMQEPVKIGPKKETKPVCLNCGHVLTGQQRKYCSEDCEREYRNKTRRVK